MSEAPSSLLRAWLLLLFAASAGCALPGGPPLPEMAQRINATLEAQVAGDGTLAERSITVLGEVAHPGAIELEADRRLTLVEAIARAGGQLKSSAHMSSLVLVRWDRANQQQLAWVIDARPKWWGAPQTIFLQPYDTVYVPNMPIDELGIWVDNYIRRMIPVPFPVYTLE